MTSDQSSLSPHCAQHRHPVLSHDSADAGLRPAAALHGGGEIRQFADGAQPLRVKDFSKAGQSPAVSLIMGDPLEEFLSVTLREIGSDAHALFTAQVDDILDRLDVILNVRLITALEERSEHGHADKPLVLRKEAQLLVALVAGMLFQTRRQAVGIGDRLLGSEDHVLTGFRPEMRQVAKNAE